MNNLSKVTRKDLGKVAKAILTELGRPDGDGENLILCEDIIKPVIAATERALGRKCFDEDDEEFHALEQRIFDHMLDYILRAAESHLQTMHYI